MAIRKTSEVVAFDADAAFADAQTLAGPELYSFVEYDVEEYQVLFLSDLALDMYDSADQAFAHFDKIHSHVHLDFTEIDLFTEGLFPVAEGVEYVTTALDFLKLVRVYHDGTGVFVSLAPTADEVPIVEAIRDHMTAT
jgi:hypothetical protein